MLPDCPERTRLRAYVLGQLPQEDAAALDAHFLGCTSCQSRLQTLDGQDPLTDAVRSAADLARKPLSEAEERVLRQMEVILQSQLAPPPPVLGDQASEKLRGNGTTLPAGPEELGWLGPYRLLGVLGTGGMGVVYRAEDPRLRREIALKTIRDCSYASPAARRRLLREGRAAAALEDDHFVPIYQVGEDNGVPYLAMRLLRGESLDQRLQRETRLALGETLRIGREIALALAAAHGSGLIHRDIKPANIWLEEARLRVILLDFGLARSPEDTAAAGSRIANAQPTSKAQTYGALEASQATQHGIVVGTPAFMAPEQATGEALDERCDLFSLGCVLYVMACGRLPFGGADAASTLVALATTEPVPLAYVDPALPARFVDLVMRLLAHEPAARPRAALEVADALGEKNFNS
jgi:serine/threonine protein kinase